MSAQPLPQPEAKKPALSISAIEMLSKCGEQYRRRYIEHERIAPGIALLVGRGVDQSVNSNLTHKIQTKELLSIEQVQDIARDSFEREWTADQVVFTKEEIQEGITKVRGRAIDKTVRLAELHGRQMAPLLQPTSVQRKWTIALPRYPMDLTGYTDIEEVLTVRDTKTSGKSPRIDEAHVSDQLTLYALAKRVLDRVQGEIRVALDYLVDLKTAPKLEVRESSRNATDFQVMLRRIETAQAAIEKGVFVPARQSDWWCAAKWCGYFHSCPYARAPKSVFIGENHVEGD